MDYIPLLAEDLIESLNKQIPPRCPRLDTPEREIWYYAGQRALVESLVNRMEFTKANSK